MKNWCRSRGLAGCPPLSLSFSLSLCLSCFLSRCGCLRNSFNGVFFWPQLSYASIVWLGGVGLDRVRVRQEKQKAGQEAEKQTGKRQGERQEKWLGKQWKIDGALIERKCQTRALWKFVVCTGIGMDDKLKNNAYRADWISPSNCLACVCVCVCMTCSCTCVLELVSFSLRILVFCILYLSKMSPVSACRIDSSIYSPLLPAVYCCHILTARVAHCGLPVCRVFY